MKPITAIWIFALLVMTAALFMNYTERQAFKRDLENAKYTHMSKADVNYVKAELKRRCCGDCILVRTSYGYICREIETGKNFRVVMK